jgi:hypothetical protein
LLAYLSLCFMPAGAQQHALNMICLYKVIPN